MEIGCSWSGGKDSCYALMQIVDKGAIPKVLLNMFNENGEISRSHGLTKHILEQQAQAMKLPLITRNSTWEKYEANFIDTLSHIKDTYKIQAFVFGDIDIDAHRNWEEKVCHSAGLMALLPIWQQDRKDLVLQMIESGVEAIITSCNTELGIDFLGKTINKEVVMELETAGVDVCGENGEFHTVVVNCPLFNKRVVLPDFEKVVVNDYCFLSWIA